MFFFVWKEFKHVSQIASDLWTIVDAQERGNQKQSWHGEHCYSKRKAHAEDRAYGLHPGGVCGARIAKRVADFRHGNCCRMICKEESDMMI